MSTATRKIVRMDLETREAFLLNSLYAIGLRVVAGTDAKEVADLMTAVKKIIVGERSADALNALTCKMRLSALSISDEDNQAMRVDP